MAETTPLDRFRTVLAGTARAIAREIAEAHGGTLTLENRADARGAVARLRIPG